MESSIYFGGHLASGLPYLAYSLWLGGDVESIPVGGVLVFFLTGPASFSRDWGSITPAYYSLSVSVQRAALVGFTVLRISNPVVHNFLRSRGRERVSINDTNSKVGHNFKKRWC